MAIGALELATIARAQDYTTIKHNEDTKGMMNQSNLSVQQNKDTEHHIKQVREGDNADNPKKKFDAKEKGNGEYSSNGDQKRRQQPDEDGRVLIKGQNKIDIKI